MSSQPSNRAMMHEKKSVLLLTTPRSYRVRPFLDAAAKLGISMVKAIEMNRQLAEYWRYPLGLDYTDVNESVDKIVSYARDHPIDAILAVDDSGSLLAAKASEALSLPYNSPDSAVAASDKYRMRQLLSSHKIPSPDFLLGHFSSEAVSEDLKDHLEQVHFPCVVKPLNLNGSRGVIRADNPDELLTAAAKLKQLLQAINPHAREWPFLIETYIPGSEVAVEAVITKGNFHVLAIFDKPDPLDGPYFEETIYVTPSRLVKAMQQQIERCTDNAAKALGLSTGPIHAELRVNESGPWIIEVAGRSIGGMCSKTLRFGTKSSLEEIILRAALNIEINSFKREETASGVMMIPIPEAGLLKGVEGCDRAEQVPCVDRVEITIQPNQMVTPLPEGDSYLGFIFASGSTPDEVESALRRAHSCLKFTIAPRLPLFAFT